MPYKSEKQRRYMWSQHPDIAKKWAKEGLDKVVKTKKSKRKMKKRRA